MSYRTGYVVVALAFAVVTAFSTITVPLYGLYAKHDDFATFAITVVYASFAVGTAASLFLAGHLSDWAGRRRMLLIGLWFELAGCVVFLVFSELPGLIVARILSGIGVGLLTAAATAYLGELRHAYAGSADASRIATLANLGGLAAGPLIGGVFAQFLPDPLVLPYVLFLVLLAAAIVGVAMTPETVVRPERMPAYRPQRIAVPRDARAGYFAAAGAAFAAFAILGLFSALVTTVLTKVLGDPSRLLAGVVAGMVFLAAALAQLATAGLSRRVQVAAAAVAVVLGLALLVAGVVLSDLALFIVSAAVAGAGVGVIFRAALSTAASLAVPQRRGEALAGIYLFAYLGVAVPVLLLGAALEIEPLRPMVVLFAVVQAAIVIVAAPMLARQHDA